MTTEQEYIEYEKYKKAKGNLFVNLFKNITSFQFAGLIVLAGIFVYFLATKNTKAVINIRTDPRTIAKKPLIGFVKIKLTLSPFLISLVVSTK